jgi:hypothetical protein
MTTKAQILSDYPKERVDWLMAIDYSVRKLTFGCILCEKTHFSKDCPNRIKKPEPKQTYTKTYAETADELDNPHNYGW